MNKYQIVDDHYFNQMVENLGTDHAYLNLQLKRKLGGQFALNCAVYRDFADAFDQVVAQIGDDHDFPMVWGGFFRNVFVAGKSPVDSFNQTVKELSDLIEIHFGAYYPEVMPVLDEFIGRLNATQASADDLWVTFCAGLAYVDTFID